MPDKGSSQATQRREHRKDIEAKRTQIVDVFGGVVTDGNFTVRVAEGSGITYIGKAQIGSATSSAEWQIQRITESGSSTSIDWANGADEFDQVWDNRASLSYS